MYDVCVCNMVKNEIEILPAFYRYIKKWATSWKLVDHGSTDGTLEFLDRMKSRGEMDIEVLEDKCDDFRGDFYKEFNTVLEKADREWTYVGHVDEFCPVMHKLIPQAIKKDIIYGFMRYEVCSLNPLLSLAREPFKRLWKTEWNFRFKLNNWVHREDLVDNGKLSVMVNTPYYHIGRCRNIPHIQSKEIDFEKCSGGNSILTSKYDELARKADRQRAMPIKDYGLMDMLL